jgi:hypothetical protein
MYLYDQPESSKKKKLESRHASARTSIFVTQESEVPN